ncbi:hypothetical protein [Methanobrevibacter sp.]
MKLQKSITFYQQKARIDKRKHYETAYKIQVYNNECVDKLVTDFDDAGAVNKVSPSILFADLTILNKPEVYGNYNKIINSKYTDNAALFNMLVKNKANKDLNRIVEAEVERISKNLNYVEQVLNKYDLDTQRYNELIQKQKNNSIANRKQILEEVAVQTNDLLVSEGLNINNNVFSYRDLETTAQSLLRQSQMTSEYDKIDAINQTAIGNGKDAPYNQKTWIHTHRGETTRHMSNHMQKVRFDEPFIVVNDKTLHIDEMMHPCDPAGSFQNAWICYCECDYGTGEYDWINHDTVQLNQTVYKPKVNFNNGLTVDLQSKQKQTNQVEPLKSNVVEPTTEQLKANLNKEEMEQVEWAKSVLSKDFHTPKMKQKAKDTLNELYSKALNKITNPKPVKTPNQEVKAEPIKPKTLTSEDKINRMTSNELYESMTKADKKKYDKFRKNYENGKKYDIPQIIEHNLMEMRKLEQKQRDKLLKRTKPKEKPKPSQYTRDLDNIHKEVDLPLDNLILELEKWIDKRCKNTSEFGYHFDIHTGKLVGDEIRGRKGRIAIEDKGKDKGSIHSHPRNGMAPPSIEDLETFRCKKEEHHFMASEHEIWYVHATDSFGIGGMGQQLDLQKAHKKCRDRAFERVSKDIKKGKIEATEESIKVKLDEYTGDEILKTFNSPPWNKTMTVRRYYR